MPSAITLAAPGFSERLAGIIEALRSAAAARAGRNRRLAPLVLLLWPYLRRVAARFDALATRWREGRIAAPAVRGSKPRASRSGRGRLPQGSAWLIRLAPETAALGSQLQYLLLDPEMAALLAAEPQAGRILRPLCRMLGIRPGPGVPPALFPPRAKPALSKPALSNPAPPNHPCPQSSPEPLTHEASGPGPVGGWLPPA